MNPVDLASTPTSRRAPEARASGNHEPLEQRHSFIDRMCRPDVYSEETQTVQLRETHISWVLLTDRFAYKIKKPVRYEFVDFSSLDLREHYCREEVRLNRRLAPHVYVGVVPITDHRHGGYKIGGRGQPKGARGQPKGAQGCVVEWAVKMRRLPDEQSLEALIRGRKLNDAHVHELAKVLAGFFHGLPPVDERTEDYRREIEAHVLANRQELLSPDLAVSAAGDQGFSPPQIKRLAARQLRLLRVAPDLLDERACDGRIVDGHGDLRPEHIYFTPDPVIIDCIEFNAEYRRLDVLDELAFLAMECDRLGAPHVGERMIARYREQNDDLYPLTLLNFYKIYRASVRAKVFALRARQLQGSPRDANLDQAREYLQLADRYLPALGKPLLIVIYGLPGTGKSTLATALADSLGAEHLQTDAIRRELFGPPDEQVGFNEGRYKSSGRRRVYAEMFRRAKQNLHSSLDVVMDGVFLESVLRSQAFELGSQTGAAVQFVHCQCPDEVARHRIASRRSEIGSGESLSETQADFFAAQKLADEPDPPNLRVFQADTSENPSAILNALFSQMRNQVVVECVS